jgi:hypothetical protein
MESVTRQQAPSRSGDGAVPVFRVVILYEDFRAAGQAKRAYDFLVANLTHEWRVSRQMWDFELLRIPELRDAAAEDARLAHVIIVACCGDGELPADVKEWIETWRTNGAGPVALIALFEAPPERAGRTRAAQACLSRAAKRGRMDFFAWPEVGLVEQTLKSSPALDRPSELVDELFHQAA